MICVKTDVYFRVSYRFEENKENFGKIAGTTVILLSVLYVMQLRAQPPFFNAAG